MFPLDQARLAHPDQDAVEVTKAEYAAIVTGQTVTVDGKSITAADGPFRIADESEATVERFLPAPEMAGDLMAPAGQTFDSGGAGFEYMVPGDQDFETADAAYIYASLSSSPILLDLQQKLLADLDALGAAYDAQEPERFHITLLYLYKIDNSQLNELLSHIQFPAAFTVDGLRIGTFREADDKPVILEINPDNALLRIQKELYERAFAMGVPISDFSRPQHYKPHVTLAYDLQPSDQKLPRLPEPVRLTVDSIIVTRPDYRMARVIRLPTLPGGAAFVIRENAPDMFERMRRTRSNTIRRTFDDLRRYFGDLVSAISRTGSPDRPLPPPERRKLLFPELPPAQDYDHVSLAYLPLTMLWGQFGDGAFEEMRAREKIESVERHYGPGPHPGTGTAQDVHGGDEAGGLSHSEAHGKLASYMQDNWEEMPHMDLAGFMDRDGRMFALPGDADNHWLASIDALYESGVWDQERSTAARMIGSGSLAPVDEMVHFGFVQFRPYGTGNILALTLEDFEELTRDQREQLGVEVELIRNLGWQVEAYPKGSRLGQPDVYGTETIRQELGLTERHQGPGTHPGTGTEQQVHAGDGAAADNGEDGGDSDNGPEDTPLDPETMLEELPPERLGERPFDLVLQDVGNIEDADPDVYWNELPQVYAAAFEQYEALKADGQREEARTLYSQIQQKMFLDNLARAEAERSYLHQTLDEFIDLEGLNARVGALDGEAQPHLLTAYLRMRTYAQDAYRFAAKRALSRGDLTPDDARERGLYDADKWVPLDQPMYHVTTAASAVAESGLMSRMELGMSRGTGLGGGDDETISFTTSPEVARDIELALREGRLVARDDITSQDLLDRAANGHNASQPYADALIMFYMNGWSEGDYASDRPLPRGLNYLLEGRDVKSFTLGVTLEEWRAEHGNEWEISEGARQRENSAGEALYTRFERPMSPEDQGEGRFELYKRFLWARQNAGGPENPVFFSSNHEALANIDEDEIRTLRFDPKPGAQGMQQGGLGEIRVVGTEGLSFVEEMQLVDESEFATRHYAPTHPGTGTGQEVHAGGGSKADIPPSEFTGPTKTFAQRINVLKRILTRPQLEIGEATVDNVDELRTAVEEGDSWNNPTALVLAEQALDWFETEAGLSEEEYGVDDYQEAATFLWEDSVEQELGDEMRYVRGLFDESVSGQTWDALRRRLELDEEEFASMGNEQVMSQIYRNIAEGRLVERWGMSGDELEGPLRNVEDEADDFLEMIREQVEDVTPYPDQIAVRDYLGNRERQLQGELPEDKFMWLGTDSGGELQAFMTADLQNIIDYSTQYSGLRSPESLGASLNLTPQQIDDVRQNQTFLHLGVLGARQTGRGYGPELMLKALQVAYENNYGIVGESLATARDFYQQLGVRWFSESSSVGFWLPADVQTAGEFIEMAGLGEELANRAISEDDIPAEGFAVWNLPDVFENAPAVMAGTGLPFEREAIKADVLWFVDQLGPRGGAPEPDDSEVAVIGRFRRVLRHYGPGSHPSGSSQEVHAGNRGGGGGTGGRETTDAGAEDNSQKVVLIQNPVKNYQFAEDDPYIQTAIEVYDAQDDETRRLIDNVRQRIEDGQTTQSMHRDAETGEYSPERVQLHEQIMADILEGKTPEEQARLIMSGGFPGSGKSTIFRMLEQQGEDFSNYVRIDSDYIKSQLPEYEGWNAALTHQEASDIIDELVYRAASQRLNIIYDGTMKTADNAQRLVGLFKEGGYDSRVMFVDVPIRVAMERAVSRFVRHDNGRFVDIEYIATNDELNRGSFESLKPLADHWEHWDNNVPLGESPILLSSGQKAEAEG